MFFSFEVTRNFIEIIKIHEWLSHVESQSEILKWFWMIVNREADIFFSFWSRNPKKIDLQNSIFDSRDRICLGLQLYIMLHGIVVNE